MPDARVDVIELYSQEDIYNFAKDRAYAIFGVSLQEVFDMLEKGLLKHTIFQMEFQAYKRQLDG